MFTSIIDTVTGTLTVGEAMLCTLASLIFGIIIAIFYMAQGRYSKNYMITLVILPALVQVIIMMVNGNLGTGVAIMGAFSLVRFRSMPGSAKEICGIFFSMVVGVVAGMGFLTYAAFITVFVGLAMLLLERSRFGEAGLHEKDLKVTIPETLDYTEVFDDIFDKYVKKSELKRVRTTNLGSMYELWYGIILRDERAEKEFIDELRTRNGNLTIVCGRVTSNEEL